jgi:hypothetical protein
VLADEAKEAETVGRWLADRSADGVQPHEIAIFVRAPAQLRRARMAAKLAGDAAVELSEKIGVGPASEFLDDLSAA